ncbi:MAG: DUF3597 domain-containing protein [Rhodospirillales bacterium]|nr:DUF3597 domain-containing protein [Rhodospirillales bacterium]
MSIFGSIMSKIFSSAEQSLGINQAAAASTKPTEVPPSAPASQTAGSPASPEQNISAAGQAQQPVDVEAVLSKMAEQKKGGGNYRTSIVDLLKLLDLDSSLNARKELAQELNVHAGADGTAEQNIALHKAVMQKLAENGGKVPDSLKG